MDILAEFEQRIAAKRKELEEEEGALAVLKRAMGLKSDVQSAVVADKTVEEKEFNFEALADHIGPMKKRTLIDEVRDVVERFGDHEFTVAHVEAALKQMGVSVDAKAPRARIGIALSNVVEEGLVVRTYDGAGNVPHRYKLKSAISDDSVA